MGNIIQEDLGVVPEEKKVLVENFASPAELIASLEEYVRGLDNTPGEEEKIAAQERAWAPRRDGGLGPIPDWTPVFQVSYPLGMVEHLLGWKPGELKKEERVCPLEIMMKDRGDRKNPGPYTDFFFKMGQLRSTNDANERAEGDWGFCFDQRTHNPVSMWWSSCDHFRCNILYKEGPNRAANGVMTLGEARDQLGIESFRRMDLPEGVYFMEVFFDPLNRKDERSFSRSYGGSHEGFYGVNLVYAFDLVNDRVRLLGHMYRGPKGLGEFVRSPQFERDLVQVSGKDWDRHTFRYIYEVPKEMRVTDLIAGSVIPKFGRADNMASLGQPNYLDPIGIKLVDQVEL